MPSEQENAKREGYSMRANAAGRNIASIAQQAIDAECSNSLVMCDTQDDADDFRGRLVTAFRAVLEKRSG